MPSLIYKRSGESDQQFEFGSKPIIIGRVAESNIIVRDTFVSRVHCGISLVDGQFTLKDLGSTNGTYRNGARVFQSNLATGDKIQVGNTALVFEIDKDNGNAMLRQAPPAATPAATATSPMPRPGVKPVTIQIPKPGPPRLNAT